MRYCYKCGKEWEGKGQPGTRDSCRGCGQDLHVCRNCRFYDPAKSRQCRIDSDEVITDKERANFCEEFQFADREPGATTANDHTADKARTQWDALFKKKK